MGEGEQKGIGLRGKEEFEWTDGRSVVSLYGYIECIAVDKRDEEYIHLRMFSYFEKRVDVDEVESVNWARKLFYVSGMWTRILHVSRMDKSGRKKFYVLLDLECFQFPQKKEFFRCGWCGSEEFERI